MLKGSMDPLALGVQHKQRPTGSNCCGKIRLPISNRQPWAS